jgi:hypothetical protein
MNFHKLLGAFWRIFLFWLSNAWNRMFTLQRPQARNTQLQYACLGDHLKTGHLWSLQNRPLWMV